MKNRKYIKSIKEPLNEQINYPSAEKIFNNEIIYEAIYRLQIDLAEYVTQRDYFDSKSEITIQEINRLDNLLN